MFRQNYRKLFKTFNNHWTHLLVFYSFCAFYILRFAFFILCIFYVIWYPLFYILYSFDWCATIPTGGARNFKISRHEKHYKIVPTKFPWNIPWICGSLMQARFIPRESQRLTGNFLTKLLETSVPVAETGPRSNR